MPRFGILPRAALLALLGMHAQQVSPDNLESLVMPGKVIAGHAEHEKDCRKCHEPFRKSGQTRLCLACHKDIARDVEHHRGFHGRLEEGRACNECHTEHKGRDARIVVLDPRDFDHRLTDFLLLGRHAQTQCRDCHPEGKKFSAAPGSCLACHRKDDTHRGKLGPDCASCHTESDWKRVRFDHGKTRFPLTGLHVQVKCEGCHRTADFKGTPRECSGCHTKDDIHKGQLGPRCESCHTDRGWKQGKFDHSRTLFPLLGAHAQSRCLDCHKSPTFQDKPPQACVACHRTDDVHKGRFGEKCATCHSETDWKRLRFDHDRDTPFALRDAHRRIKCGSCHTAPLYTVKLPATCNGCHAKQDVHRGALGSRCETCHLQTQWKATLFDHARDTRYPLLGRHAKLQCKACHADGSFGDKLQTQCMACHRNDDVHAGQQGSRCESCHGETSWKTVRFDHAAARFPLLGSHLKVACGSCHTTMKFKDAPSACVGCHRSDDTHKGRLGAVCESCHNARDWRIWDFDHGRTSFRLDGAHLEVSCVACHVRAGEKIASLGSRCVDCHESDDVHHGTFGANCERCHFTSSFGELRGTSRPRLR
jgi:hypothetical protein